MKPMLRILVALSALPALVATVDSHADERGAPAPAEQPAGGLPQSLARPGPQAALKVGFGLGAGVVYSGVSLTDTMSGAVPIQLDLGWRFLPEFYAGIYGQFAPVFRKNDPVTCPAGFSCASQDWRVGIEAEVHFRPLRFDPYIGLGVGYEILHSTASGTTPLPNTAAAAGVDVSATDRGREFVSVTLGIDWRFGRMFGVGPFISASAGEYNVHTGTQSVTVPGAPAMSSPLPDVGHAGHELATLGLRGTFSP